MSLVIGDVLNVPTVQDIVPHVKKTELKPQPVSVQKKLSKFSDKLNVIHVLKSVKNVLIVLPTV